MATREEMKAAAAAAKAEAEAEAAAREKAEAEAKAKAEEEAKAKAEADAKAQAHAAEKAVLAEVEVKVKAEADVVANARGFRVQRVDRHREVAFYCEVGPLPGWNADRDLAATFPSRAAAKKIADLHTGDGDVSVEKID